MLSLRRVDALGIPLVVRRLLGRVLLQPSRSRRPCRQEFLIRPSVGPVDPLTLFTLGNPKAAYNEQKVTVA